MPVLLFVAIAWLVLPSTVTVYPSGSRLEPPVLVVTVRFPVVAEQLMKTAVVAPPPLATLAVCGLALVMLLSAATPEPATLWLPAGSAVMVLPVLLFVAIASLVVP